MRFLKRTYWEGGRDRWNQALDQYAAHFATIEERLPKTARLFIQCDRRYVLHDEALHGLYQLGQDRVSLALDRFWIDFFEVEDCRFHQHDHTHLGVWLVAELDSLEPNLFRMSVLFQHADLEIDAGIVHVYSKQLRRYLVPDDMQSTRDVTTSRKKRSKSRHK